MRLKIRCDGESWKFLGFRVEVNKALFASRFGWYPKWVLFGFEDVLRDPKHFALPILHLGCVVGDSLTELNLEQLSVLLAPIEDLHWTTNLKYIHFAWAHDEASDF